MVLQDDLDRLMEVMNSAFDPEYGEAWTRRQVEDALLIGRCHHLLSGPDGEDLNGTVQNDVPVAGFALSRSGFEEEELLLFAVKPQYRGRGVGASLLKRFIATARARGASRLLLEMRQGNQAESLYRRYGFIPEGVRKNYYRTLRGPLLDAITFTCE